MKTSPLLLIVAVGVSLGGCMTSNNPDDPNVWGRFDCMDNPAGELEQAKAICSGRAQANAVMGTVGMPSSGPRLSNAIVDGISAGIAQGQIANATLTSCMAEFGFTLRPRSVNALSCPAPEKGPSAKAGRATARVAPAPQARIGLQLSAPVMQRPTMVAPAPRSRGADVLDSF